MHSFWPKIGSTARHSICYTVGMLRGWKCIFVGVAVAFAFGCMSPTLPLPPPAAPSELADTDPTKVTLHGTNAQPASTIIIYNLNPQASENLNETQKVTATLVREDGTWDATIFAMKGDTVTIYDIEDGEWSQSTTYTIAN